MTLEISEDLEENKFMRLICTCVEYYNVSNKELHYNGLCNEKLKWIHYVLVTYIYDIIYEQIICCCLRKISSM